MVSQLVDINTAAILVQIDRCFCRNVLLLENHLSKKIEDRNCEPFLVAFFEVKSDVGGGRVRIKT